MARITAPRSPTEAELAILQVLWRKGPSSVRAVCNEIGDRWGYTTVLKFLQIMLEKGLVARNEDQTSHVYAAISSEKDTQEKILQGLTERLFAGSTGQLILRALSAKPVAPSELRAIRELLAKEELRNSKRKDSK
jgi:predicted transcriptional regulator